MKRPSNANSVPRVSYQMVACTIDFSQWISEASAFTRRLPERPKEREPYNVFTRSGCLPQAPVVLTGVEVLPIWGAISMCHDATGGVWGTFPAFSFSCASRSWLDCLGDLRSLQTSSFSTVWAFSTLLFGPHIHIFSLSSVAFIRCRYHLYVHTVLPTHNHIGYILHVAFGLLGNGLMRLR